MVQYHRIDQESPSTTIDLEPDLGAVTSNLKSILKLINRRVMFMPDYKNLISQML